MDCDPVTLKACVIRSKDALRSFETLLDQVLHDLADHPSQIDFHLIQGQVVENQSLLNCKLDEIRALLNQSMNRRNVPVYRLPEEILVKIFSYTGSFGGEFKSRARCASVSRDWFALVQSTPAFWTRLDSTCPPTIWARTLDLNHTGPLDISINSRLGDLKGFLDLVVTESRRWRVLDASGDLRELLPEDGTLNVQSLAECTLHHLSPFYKNPYLDLGDGRPLRVLDLQCVTVPWTSARLTNLHSLKLKTLKPDPRTFPHDLMVMLKSSPALVTFVIEDISMAYLPQMFSSHASLDGTQPSTQSIQGQPIIQLPFLSTFVISDIAFMFMDALVSSLQTPSLKTLEVFELEPLRLRPHSPLAFSLHRLLLCIKGLKVIYNASGGKLIISSVSLEVVPGIVSDQGPADIKLNISFDLESPHPSPTFWDDFLAICGPKGLSAPTELILSGQERAGSVSPFRVEAIRGFSNLYIIHFKSNFGAVSDVLSFINHAEPLMNDNSYGLGTIAPNLDSIRIYDAWNNDVGTMLSDIFHFLRGQTHKHVRRINSVILPKIVHAAIHELINTGLPCVRIWPVNIWGVAWPTDPPWGF